MKSANPEEIFIEYFKSKGAELKLMKEERLDSEMVKCYYPIPIDFSHGLPTAYLLGVNISGPMNHLSSRIFDYQAEQCKLVIADLEKIGIQPTDIHLAVRIYTMALLNDGMIAALFSSDQGRTSLARKLSHFYSLIRNDPRLIMGGVITIVPKIKIGLTVLNTGVNHFLRVKHRFLYLDEFTDELNGEFKLDEIFEELDYNFEINRD